MINRLLLVTLALTVPLEASAQPYRSAPTGQDSGCNAGQTAMAGAMLGALVGGLAGGGRHRGGHIAAGALIGAAAGGIGCTAFNSRVPRQRSNAEVAQQYAPPARPLDRPMVVNYETQPSAQSFGLGQDVVLRSHMVVAIPDAQAGLPIAERYTITTPEGQQKVFVKEVAQGGGELTNELTFRLPQAMPRGVYRVRTELLVGEQPMSHAQTAFQVV